MGTLRIMSLKTRTFLFLPRKWRREGLPTGPGMTAPKAIKNQAPLFLSAVSAQALCLVRSGFWTTAIPPVLGMKSRGGEQRWRTPAQCPPPTHTEELCQKPHGNFCSWCLLGFSTMITIPRGELISVAELVEKIAASQDQASVGSTGGRRSLRRGRWRLPWVVSKKGYLAGRVAPCRSAEPCALASSPPGASLWA